MANIFFTADTHFSHKLVAGLRGFESTEDHEEPESGESLAARASSTAGLASFAYLRAYIPTTTGQVTSDAQPHGRTTFTGDWKRAEA